MNETGSNGPGAADIVKRLRAGFESGRTRPVDWRIGAAATARSDADRTGDRVPRRCSRPTSASPRSRASSPRPCSPAPRSTSRSRTSTGGSQPEKVSVPLTQQPAKAQIVREPLGVVLVIGPWNYPIQLVLAPLVAAHRGGERRGDQAVGARTGELTRRSPDWWRSTSTPSVSRSSRVGSPRPPRCSRERWDHIFYTGNGTVGRVVMEAAAKHLTPVTLELGGKSPAIVDRHAQRGGRGEADRVGQVRQHRSDLRGARLRPRRPCGRAAVPRRPSRRRYAASTATTRARAPTTAGSSTTATSPACRASSTPAASRSSVAWATPPSATSRPPCSPRSTATRRSCARRSSDRSCRSLPVDDVDEAIDFVNERDKPLAVYVFSEVDSVADRVIASTSAGGVAVNATVLHLAVPGLPFGGVGASGMGAYHGRAGFETFSHRKSVLNRPTRLDVPVTYPPYSGLEAEAPPPTALRHTTRGPIDERRITRPSKTAGVARPRPTTPWCTAT